MQPDKKQLEILIVNYFHACYEDFPKGQLNPSESPDFIIKMKNRRELGIEVTRLTPAVIDYHDENNLAHISVREEIVGLSKDLFEQNSALKLFVKILFSDVKLISAESQISVAVHVVNIIRKAVRNKSGDSLFVESISGEMLPGGIDEILIVNHPVMQTSAWERANNLGVSNDVVDDIRRAIHKKDEKLHRLYQKQRLNYYWLLITTDRLHGVKTFNLPEKIMNHEFHSEFQHVFLFDLIKASVYQLV
jgi:hypothetical protein